MAVEIIDVPGGELLVRMRGDFSGPDAWAVQEALSAHDGATAVILDFTRVQRYEDFAVALLAPTLAAPGGRRIRLRGMGLHQRRVLEYFGVPGAATGERARGDAELPAAHA